jgi:CII-binding regulator of phage lambda lysogenization HflD
MEKEKIYGSSDINIEDQQILKASGNSSSNNANLDKYKEFLIILKEDLRKLMDKNLALGNEINETEEERQYYLGKIQNVMNFCKKVDGENDATAIADIITHVPEDFK